MQPARNMQTLDRLLKKPVNTAFVVIFLLFQNVLAEEFHEFQVYRLATEKSFDDVIEDLKFAIGENNFRLTGENRIGRTIALREEKPFPQATILHFCNLKYAEKFLTIDPAYLIRMPCRIAVRQAENRVIIETWLQPVTRKDLCKPVEEINRILKNIVQYAAE